MKNKIDLKTKHFDVHNSLYARHLKHLYTDQEFQKIQNSKILSYVYNYEHIFDHGIEYDLLAELPMELRQEFLSNGNYKLVIDYRTEGAPWQRRDFYSMLYYTRDKYRLPSNKFAFWTSNLKEHYAYEHWKTIHDRDQEPDPIQCVVWQFWQSEARAFSDPEFNDSKTSLNYKVLDSNKRVQTSLLCMNRRPHIHRRLLQAELFRTEHYKKMLISADQFSHSLELDLSKDWPVDQQLAQQMNQSMPWLLDTDTLEHNLVNTAPLGLYQKTVASIVTESENQHYSKCCMFFSEKTFKAMLFGHPILILGIQNQTHYLKELGFELFEDYFDYSYDLEKNLWDRVSKLATEIRRILDNDVIVDMKLDNTVRKRIKHNRSIILEDQFNQLPAQQVLKWLTPR